LLGAFSFHTCGDIVLISRRRQAPKFNVLGMVMEGHSAAFARFLTVPYQDIAAGSLHSSQQHPAYSRGMILRSVTEARRMG